MVLGDITDQTTDAIVNAANSSLLGGGGVDGAIHRAAGLELLEACKTLNGCPTGEARITKGFKLSAQYVIHTVGPIWHGGSRKEEYLLAQCYKSVFRLAEEYKLNTIAFPSISTGAYRFPLVRAAQIAIGETLDFLKCTKLNLIVWFVCFDLRTKETYEFILNETE